MLGHRPAALSLVLISGLGLGCGDPEHRPCEEREGVTDALTRVPLTVRSVEIAAEVARTEDDRAAAWVQRRCELDALLWVPDEVGPVSLALCDVLVGVDLAFLRDGEVVAMERDRAPCSSACDACPTYGDDVPSVDAVLWLISGELEIEVGDAIGGLTEVDLPTDAAASTG